MAEKTNHFIREIIETDIKNKKNEGRVHTRFPPEPNGYLHIGHAKSICLNFGMALDYQGKCNLRFDDTNPEKEETEYVKAIEADLHWLGYDWEGRLFYASSYFENFYQAAVQLIEQGDAYVCSLPADQIRETRGTLTEPGSNSPFRNRDSKESLELLAKMRKGELDEGSHVVRAKIDMASPNLNMRDPVLYRIRKVVHHQTGNAWFIYPMYDFAHCISDMLEGITHSLCTLEFEDHRPLYDWVLEKLKTKHRPQQIEFARLNLDYTVMSKRRLLQLVKEKHVDGWDDPRMPTIKAMKRRGYSANAIRNFCERIGVTKKDSSIELSFLEQCVREDLEDRAPRALAVLRPLRVVIENYPEGKVEELEVSNHPKRPEMGSRTVPFSKVIYIEQEDFMEEPPKNFFRLSPGVEVRLRGAYFLRCTGVKKDEQGNIIELTATYDPESKAGKASDGRKVKGTLHWVSESHSVPAEIRLYDRLFKSPFPGRGGADFIEDLNPESRVILTQARVEPLLKNLKKGDTVQFERQGYFCADDQDFSSERLVFNRTVTLKDSWVKINK